MMSVKENTAFEKYYQLTQTGVKTTSAIQNIANELDVSVRTVYKWKKSGQWDKRATERSIETSKKIQQDLARKGDDVVTDFRKPFIKMLNRLVMRCMKADKLEIQSIKELLDVMELSTRLQKELDMVNVPIISAEYSREKHIKEINTVLGKLKERDEKEIAKEKMRAKDESRLQQTQILDPRQTDLRANSTR